MAPPAATPKQERTDNRADQAPEHAAKHDEGPVRTCGVNPDEDRDEWECCSDGPGDKTNDHEPDDYKELPSEATHASSDGRSSV